MRLRWMVAGAGICAVSLIAGASPALAAGHGVTAVTHTRHHPDTSTVAGTCTKTSTGGPVWAYDNLTFRFRVVPGKTSGTYSVTITSSGSYRAFASRTTGACTTERGSVHGWVKYTVTSTKGPNRKDLPVQEKGAVSQGTMLTQLFQTTVTVTASGGYRYTYTMGGKRCVTSTTGFHCS